MRVAFDANNDDRQIHFYAGTRQAIEQLAETSEDIELIPDWFIDRWLESPSNTRFKDFLMEHLDFCLTVEPEEILKSVRNITQSPDAESSR